MFHSKVIGAKSRNLDLYMCSEETVKHLFGENSRDTDFSIIEGVMGIYDGLSNKDECSSNHLSLVTDTPEILIVNTKGMSLSLVAQISGYLNFRKNNIKGVILNRANERMYPFFRQMIEKELKIKVYGYLPEIKDIAFESRHLGLVTAEEIEDLKLKLKILADACEATIDLDGLMELGNNHRSFNYNRIEVRNLVPQNSIRIAIARDKAFCFYYEDNIELLEKLGAEIVYFSPLRDKRVPQDIDGLILGGGYPEEYAKELSENTSMLSSVKATIERGTPVIAECGGFMYLCKSIVDQYETSYPMVGVIDTTVKMTKRLSNFGYMRISANKDNLLCKRGESLKAHEFHYSNSDNNGSDFSAEKLSGKRWDCIHANKKMFVGYPHIHFWGNVESVKNFIMECKK